MIARSLMALAATASPLAAQSPDDRSAGFQPAVFADLALIDHEVARFTGAGIGQQGGAALPVDRRLRLAPCRAPLALAWRMPRRDTVVVQCPDAGGWRLFVPLAAAAGGVAAGAAAPVIARGDAVTIAVTGEGFTIAQPGEAMEAGAVGAWIRVRTQQGGRAAADPVRARVERPGLVMLPLP